MTSSTMQLVNACKEDPSLIFTYIKEGKYREVAELIVGNVVSINTEDSVGNDVLTRLLKAKQYDLVMILMKKKNWDVNHQNIEGDTFAHILAMDDDHKSMQIVDSLVKKKRYLPNIKNNLGQTAFDKATTNNYLIKSLKMFEDKRLTNIDLIEIKKLFTLSVADKYFGKYSRLNNFNLIINSLNKKELSPIVQELVDRINENKIAIKENIMDDKIDLIERIINTTINEYAS